MTTAEIKTKLYDNTFLLGQFRQRAAIKKLACSNNSSDFLLLAEALANNHPNAKFIKESLEKLDLVSDSDKIVALWIFWLQTPQIDLAQVLAKLGWPAAQVMETRNIRTLLMLANVDTAPEILNTVTVFAKALPVNDEGWNDEIYLAWVRSKSAALEQLIIEQKRQPSSTSLDALHALVTGNIARYNALNDENGAILAQAFVLASPGFRERMARTVAISTDRRLKEAYRRALTGGNINEMKVIANLKLVGDHDGLFEKTRFLRLGSVLELCEYWDNNPDGRPSRPKLKEVVDRAVAAYKTLTKLQNKNIKIPLLSSGLMDIFEYWRQQPLNNEIEIDLKSRDPVRRAYALYLGYRRGVIDSNKLKNLVYSPDWLERLVVKLLDPNALVNAKEDHVCWVSECAGEPAMLQIPIAGTPEDYRRHNELLKHSNDNRVKALLEILCAFQGTFIASGISVDEIDDAIEPGAIEVEIEEANEEFL